MSHLKTNPVQALRRILRDHYQFPAIIKELLQNADDAKAHRFHIAWTPDWPTVTHPLLASPALLVLNDGEFRKADAEAICHLDEGSKGEDLTAIGKYGLGMKSVFHLCEAFFFAASPNQPAACGTPFLDILNPWPEGGPHDAWNNLRKAKDGVFQRLASWQHGCDRWFCIIIPLRTVQQLEGAEPIVQGQYPSIAEFRKEHSDLQLVRYLPLLRSLGEVVVWDWDGRARNWTTMSRILADPAQHAACTFPAIDRGTQKRIHTRFLIHAPDGSRGPAASLTVGIESLLRDDRFQLLKADPRWPKNLTINPTTGRSEDRSEKAEPHCAAVFTASPSTQGKLDVDMAVFLPLSKRLFEPVEMAGTTAYQLLLHGQYFLDAGRRELYEADGAHDGVQEEWNALLLNDGVLPLVIPALSAFQTTAKLSDEQTEELTRGLERSSLTRDYCRHVCRESNWLWRLTLDDSRVGTWTAAPARDGYLELASISDGDVSQYTDLFPSLRSLCSRVVITLQGKPRLTAIGPQNWSQVPQYLNELIDSLPLNVFCDGKRLQLLASFLNRGCGVLPDTSRRMLVQKVAAAIAEHGIGWMRSAGDAFRSLLSALESSSYVRLGPVDRDAEPLLRELNALSLGVLLLPHDVPSPERATHRLSLVAAQKAMTWLEGTAARRPAARSAAVAVRLVESTDGSPEERLEALGRFSVFLVRDAGGRETLTSWKALSGLVQEKRLFVGGSAYLAALQKALRGASVYSLFSPADSQPFRVLFGLPESPSCTRQACIECLCQHTGDLAPLTDRLELLGKLVSGLDGVPETGHLMAVRYLIHGSREHLRDMDTPLLVRASISTGGVIGQITELALRRLRSEWRWVSDSVYECLSPTQLRAFGIEPVELRILETLLVETGVDWLDSTQLGREETEALLLQIQNVDLWRRLPLHETVQGRRVSLAGRHAYMQSAIGQGVPTALSDVVTILIRPRDLALCAKYQQCRVASWDDVAAIDVALAQAQPQSFVSDVLDAVNRVACNNGSLPPETLQRLRDTTWIPSVRGAVAPNRLIYLREVEDELRRLAGDVELHGQLVCHFHLPSSVTEHPGFGKLRQRQVFLDRDGSLTLLGSYITGMPRYAIGDVQEVGDAPTMRKLLCAFDGKADDLLPGVRLIGALTQAYPESDTAIVDRLLCAMRESLSITLLQSCLQVLSSRHETANRHDKATCEEVFRWYLRQLLGAPAFRREDLTSVRLLSASGAWTSPTRLCLSAEGIDGAHLLDMDQARLFPHTRDGVSAGSPIAEDCPENVSDYGDAAALVSYFRRWEGLVPRSLIGAFLSLLGDQAELLAAAREYLAPHSIEFVRGQIEWPVYSGTMTTGADEDIWTSMQKQRFLVRFGDAQATVRVPNLVGGVFEATVGEHITSVFIGDLFFTHLRTSQPPYRTKPVTVRVFDVEAWSLEQRRSILFESARNLLDKVYNRRPGNLSALWDVLADTGQFELEIVQEQLLQSAWFYFQQLGHGRLPKLRDLTRKHDSLTDRLIELRHKVSSAESTEVAAIEHELRALVMQLKTLLEEDEQVQGNTLDAVRRKMTDFEYSVGSIPFELLQNADDAAAELAEMLGDQAPPTGLDTIILELECGVFRLIHWGRPINEFRRGDFGSDKGRDRGYHNDLKKMLVLTASDKTERAEVVTGKFGLGFKTVFFVSKQPAVVSADLGFEVIGGFYPRRLAEPTLHRLRAVLDREMPARADGTIIELPLADDVAGPLGAAITRYQHLLPIVLAFTREIKRCEIRGVGGSLIRASWREAPLCGVTSCAVGCLEGQDRDHAAVARRAMIIRDDARGVLFLALDSLGFTALSDDVPTFWVTAPTTEHRRVGFAVNAAFSLDVGRKQLADSEENAQAGRALGQATGAALVELYDLSLQWEGFAGALGLASEVSATTFWSSLWQLLAVPEVAGDLLLREIIWAPGGGMARLASDRPAIPSCLSDEYDTLIRRDDITDVVDGLLDADLELFAAVSRWPGFAAICRPGKAASQRRVFGFLRSALGGDSPIAKPVTLADALRHALSDDLEVSAALAAQLGAVLNRAAFKEWAAHADGRVECEACRELLGTTAFRSQAGLCSKATELLVPSLATDEARRAAFAPAMHLLDPSYAGDGIEFFLLCRGEINAPASRLAQWAVGATTDAARRAVLDYILRGELGSPMAEHLRHSKGGTWLENPSKELLAAYEECDQLKLLGALGATFNQVNEFHSHSASTSVLARSPQDILQAVVQWWSGCHAEQLARFEHRLYEDGRFPSISQANQEDPASAEAWLRLFLLGLLQTIGWTSDERNREFVKDCNHRGWISALVDARRDPVLWLQRVDEYIEQQTDMIEYFQSMTRLMGLFVIARRLHEYVDAFLAIDRVRGAFPLTDVTRPRVAPMFQGGGPDAPPIAGVLGIGQCFVVRELARHGVIRNAHAHPYCYVPFKRLRRLMQCIDPELMLDESGGRWDQSKAIYRCLEKHLGAGAIFDGAFDVPLLVVSENAALQERLLGRVVPDEEGQVAGRPDEGWRTLPDGRRINLNG